MRVVSRKGGGFRRRLWSEEGADSLLPAYGMSLLVVAAALAGRDDPGRDASA